MKFLFAISLILSFTSVAVFGVFGMNHGAGQSHDSGCIAAMAQGKDCPTEADPIASVDFHIDAFLGFSLAIFGESIMSTLLFAFALLLFISLAFFSPPFFQLPELALERRRFRDSFFLSQRQVLNRWLALHENSPSLF